MSVQALIEAFRLPPQALLAHRIPKKMLVEQGAPTAADKRLINDTVDELWWHAALKPGTIGVPASSGPEGEVIELALISVQLKPDSRDARAQRLRQLIHRAIPYPVRVGPRRARCSTPWLWQPAPGEACTQPADPVKSSVPPSP